MILLSIVVNAIDRPNRNRRIDRTNWCTFLVKNGKVDRQQVSIGQRSDLAAEIQQGVKPGGRVSPRSKFYRELEE